MTRALLEIVIGYFITYKVPNIVGAKGLLATIIKIIGIILLIGGFISLVDKVL